MIKNKLWFSEMVLLELTPTMRSKDEDIDQREVILRLDAIVNQLAKEGFLENWKFGFFDNSEELFKTRFEWITCTDPTRGNSYAAIPTNWVSLPKQMGLDEVYFKNDPQAVTRKYFDPVIITSRKDVSLYRNTMAAGNQGRISCYPQGLTLYFDRPKINATYGQIGMALLIRDSSQISDTDLFPVPANMEQTLIDTCVAWFKQRLNQMPDLVRDDVIKS